MRKYLIGLLLALGLVLGTTAQAQAGNEWLSVGSLAKFAPAHTHSPQQQCVAWHTDTEPRLSGARCVSGADGNWYQGVNQCLDFDTWSYYYRFGNLEQVQVAQYVVDSYTWCEAGDVINAHGTATYWL